MTEPEDIDNVLSGIEMDHTVDQLNGNTIALRTPDGVLEITMSDFSVLPGGELMIYRAYVCPTGEKHPHQQIASVYARGEWISFERVEDDE